eukprot:jgi/Bigna1/88460/estExt_fgenesh1_pg.C_320074
MSQNMNSLRFHGAYRFLVIHQNSRMSSPPSPPCKPIDFKALHLARMERNKFKARNIKIKDGFEFIVVEKSGLGIGSLVWDAGEALSRYLVDRCSKGSSENGADDSELKGKRVLELGSGVGIAGTCAAMLGARVTLTDKKELVDLLRRTANENKKRLAFPMHVQELEWGSCNCLFHHADNQASSSSSSESFTGSKPEPNSWGKEEKNAKSTPVQEEACFDLILGADILYVPEDSLRLLLREIQAQSTAKTRTILAFKYRKGKEKEFFKWAQESGLKVEHLAGPDIISAQSEEATRISKKDDGFSCCIYALANGDKLNVEKTK